MKNANIKDEVLDEVTKRMFEKFDLQLFADDDQDNDNNMDDDEDPIDGGYTGDDEDDDDDYSDDDDQNDDDSDDSDEEHDDPKDKQTNAIIKYKKAAKEAMKRAEEAEKKLLEKESSDFIEKETEKLINEGHSKEAATDIAKLREENQRFKMNSLNSEIKALNAEYPGADQFSSEIKALKLGEFASLSIEEIFMAKFYKKIGFDLKTDAEQKALYNANKAREKSKADGGSPAGKSTAKLSAKQEQIYKEVLKSHPTMTRARFLELEDESAEIKG